MVLSLAKMPLFQGKSACRHTYCASCSDSSMRHNTRTRQSALLWWWEPGQDTSVQFSDCSERLCVAEVFLLFWEPCPSPGFLSGWRWWLSWTLILLPPQPGAAPTDVHPTSGFFWIFLMTWDWFNPGRWKPWVEKALLPLLCRLPWPCARGFSVWCFYGKLHIIYVTIFIYVICNLYNYKYIIVSITYIISVYVMHYMFMLLYVLHVTYYTLHIIY